MAQNDKRLLFLYIAITYIFAIAIRYYWIDWARGFEEFLYNNQVMINTNDGYFFLTGAKNLIFGGYEYNLRVPGLERGLIAITVILAKITPFSLDTLALYMPGFIIGLIVIPIILIMRLFNKTFIGFLAAVVTTVVWSFYHRTMYGYYDSDMFALMMPLYILYFLFRVIKFKNFNDVIISSILIWLYFWTYNPSKPLVYALIFLFWGYLFFQDRKWKYFYSTITLQSIAMIGFRWYIDIFFILIAAYFLKKDFLASKDIKTQKIYTSLALLAFIMFSNFLLTIVHKITSYLKIVSTLENKTTLHFFNVMETIREASNIPFSLLANRISGSIAIFILSFVGYILLVLKERIFILTLPLVGLGLFAYFGGLRFTVYAVPIFAISFFYFFDYILGLILNKKEFLKYPILAIVAALFLYPNITHMMHYLVKPVFTKYEVEDLEKLNKISTNKDYTISWWDYGYPIWYYSNTNTLIDGGKHQNDNFIVSKIFLTPSSSLSANLARLSIEKYIKYGKEEGYIAQRIFEDTNTTNDPALLMAMLENNQVKLPKKSVDIFFFMPLRMAPIFPTVALFSNLDLLSGKSFKDITFYPAYILKRDKNILLFNRGIYFDIEKGILVLGKGEKSYIKRFIIVDDRKGEIKRVVQNYPNNSNLSIIYLVPNKKRRLLSYNALIVGERAFNSLYVQMGILGIYDKKYFEPVIISPVSRIYKLKI